MVAALVEWHEHHLAAAREISSRLESGSAMVVAAPALVEAYAVLTRLPAPHRLAAADALALLEANFGGQPVAALDGAGYRSLLGAAPGLSVSGGRIYDAVIARCAQHAGVGTLLTFNERHFRGLVKDLEIVVPTV
jgi:predicted nucleic acid-binding protein